MPNTHPIPQSLLSGKQYLRALAALVEQAPVGMCVLDERGTYLVVNRALATINGLPVDAHIGRTVAEVVPDIWARAREAIEHALRSPLPLVDMLLEGETNRAPGEVRQFVESWFPLPVDEAGNVRVAIIVREVTAERRMTQELQDADKRKDEFLATLAHELRNPLAPLTHCVPLMRKFTDPKAPQVADIVERQLNMLTRLVEDLSDASRIRSGKFELRWENIDLGDVLQDVLTNTLPNGNATRHTVVSDLPQYAIGIRGDGVRLRQLFANLLNNACKFTPADGRISVSLKLSESDVVVSVSDSGIGIPPHKLRSIFARLAQGDIPPDMRAQGLGIGLWLAREIAELHGGSIEAFSEGLGYGSRFDVRLPLREKP